VCGLLLQGTPLTGGIRISNLVIFEIGLFQLIVIKLSFNMEVNMTPLMKRLMARIDQFLTDSINAKSFTQAIWGVRPQNKFQLQQDFVADIKTFYNAAVMLGDVDVQRMCKMQARQQVKQIENDCNEILGNDNDGGEA